MNSGDAPFSIQADSIRGRYLEAAKDISQGDIIFQERPLMVGPCGVGIEKSKTFSTCLGCYKNVTSFYKCSKCGWPVCNFQCEMMPDHSNFECVVFATCPVSPIVSPLEYEKIKILRCLMLKEKSPDKWKLLMNLQSHIANRKQDVAAVSRDISYYKFIKDECHLLKQFPFNEISHFSGVCAINSYSRNGLLGQCYSDGPLRHASFLFYFASFLTHDCIPNARSVIQQKGKSFVINVIATTNIKYKDPITISYVEPSCGTLERRAYLLDNFYFSCKCSRCRDPTEIGTYLSSVKCTSDSCKNGWLISKNPIDPNSNWICNQNLTAGCNASDVNVMLVEDILQDVKAKIRKAGSLNEFMDILEFYKNKTLHKNHYLVINMECEILRLIDVALSTVFDEPERLRLAKWQVDLCRHCLSVADLIQPGNNKFRGNLLCVLQDALLTICTGKINQCYDAKEFDIIRKRCKKELAEALETMKEAKSILMAEPVGSSEWQRGTTLSLETTRVKSLMKCLSFKD